MSSRLDVPADGNEDIRVRLAEIREKLEENESAIEELCEDEFFEEEE